MESYLCQNNKEMEFWLRRIGHINLHDLKDATKYKIRDLDLGTDSQFPVCETCIKGKMSAIKFEPVKNRKTELLEIVHTDLCGPMEVASKGGSLYFITFIDDCTRW